MHSFKIIILIVFVISLSACSRDLGNYDYHPINEIEIAGLNKTYAVVTDVDVLHIEPSITMTETVADPARIAYYWIVYKGTTVIDTIGREAILHYPVKLLPDSYNLFLRIVDKATTVAWKSGTALTVGTPYSRGILLMGTNESGNAEAQMISMVRDTLIVDGLLSKSGLPALKDPVSFVHTGGTATGSGLRLWAFTKTGSYFFDRLTMKASTSNNFGSILYTTDNVDKANLVPILLVPQVRDANGAAGNNYTRAMLCTDGNIYTCYTLLNGGDLYTNPINRLSDNFGKLLKVAPYLFYSIANMNSTMWYDSENDRFMNYTSYGLNNSSSVLADAANSVFPWDQKASGRKLVYGENTRNTDGGSTNGNSFAIMKDANNKHYIYKFYANGTQPAKRDAYEVLPVATNFGQADFYAFSSKRTVVFYSVGNTLYAYDYNKGLEKAYQYPQIGSDPITMLKFDTQIDYTTNSLYIGTYNETTKGTLRRFNVGSNPDVVEVTPVERASWNGLVRIKDMNWRAFN